MNTKIITVYQDQKQKIENHQAHADNVNFLKNVMGENNISLETNGKLLVRNYVGFISRKNTSLQILPKIYAGEKVESKEEINASYKFLFRLLKHSEYFTFKKFNETSIDTERDTLLEIFITIYASELSEILKRQSFRAYIPTVENMPFIKGKILFQQSLIENLSLRHRHVVQYDDFSPDNPLNQFLKTTAQQLLTHSKNETNRKMLRECIATMEEVSSVNITGTFITSILFNRLNQDYEKLYVLAKLFYQGLQPNFNYGAERTFAFIIPLNALYEQYLLSILKEYVKSYRKTTVSYQDNRYIAIDSNKNKAINIKPDFIIRRPQESSIILDAKFKNPTNSNGKPDIASSDIYQLLTYAVGYNCENIVMIYPRFIGINEKQGIIETWTLKEKVNRKSIKLHIALLDITQEDENNPMGIDKNVETMEEILKEIQESSAPQAAGVAH